MLSFESIPAPLLIKLIITRYCIVFSSSKAAAISVVAGTEEVVEDVVEDVVFFFDLQQIEIVFSTTLFIPCFFN